MKTFSILWTLLTGVLIFTSCGVDELATPAMDNRSQLTARKGGAQTSATVYGGQATGLYANITEMQNGVVTSNVTILSQTAMLPASGGNLNANASQAFIEGYLSADSLQASVTGTNNQTASQSSVENVLVTVDGNVISADYISATATTTCGAATGSTQIQNLIVNGNPIIVTGAPNQVVYLSAGSFIIINEQSTSKKVKAKNMNVTGLHIIIPGDADIKLATARAETKC